MLQFEALKGSLSNNNTWLDPNVWAGMDSVFAGVQRAVDSVQKLSGVSSEADVQLHSTSFDLDLKGLHPLKHQHAGREHLDLDMKRHKKRGQLSKGTKVIFIYVFSQSLRTHILPNLDN